MLTLEAAGPDGSVVMAVDWIGFSYAVVLSAGGVMGYVKAGGNTFDWV